MNISQKEFEILESLMRIKELPENCNFAMIADMASRGLVESHISGSVVITEKGEDFYLTQGGIL